MPEQETIVITGVGLTSPLGNELATLRRNLLEGVSGVSTMETRFMGEVFAGICNFDERKHQSGKERRGGTRAGSISIFCATKQSPVPGSIWMRSGAAESAYSSA